MKNPTDSPAAPLWPEKWENPDNLIAGCMVAVRSGIEAVQTDPLRPQFHFLPPARWMNDGIYLVINLAD